MTTQAAPDRSTKKRDYLLAGVVLLGLVALGFSIWVLGSSATQVKTVLRFLSPVSLELCFLLLVATALASRRAITRSLPRRGYLVLGLALAALLLVKNLPPQTHRIYYDEDIYQSVAQNLIWEGAAQMCNEGIVDAGTFRCDAWEYPKEPNGFPFLLSTLFRFTGVSEGAAFRLNHWLFALGVATTFWLGGMLFGSTLAASGSAVIYMMTPETLRWSGTTAVEPGAAAFSLLAVAAWVLFVRERSWPTAVFAASAIAFACQWRPEAGLLIGVAVMATVLLAPSMFRRRELYLAALLVGFLLLPHFAHTWTVRGEDWGSSEGGKFSTDYVASNLKTNARYYVEGEELPRYFSFLAILGLLAPGRRRESSFLVLWFLVMFGVFIPFHAGSYRYGADIRFSLVSAAPFALLAGCGVAWLADWISRQTAARAWARSVPLVLAIYAFTTTLPHVRAVGREAWAAREDHKVALEMQSLLPHDSIVLSHNPGMWQVFGQSAVQASVATTEPAKVDGYFHRFAGGVYFHYSFWCNVNEPVQNEFCANVLATFGTRVEMEQSAGFNRYVLYRLLPRTVAPAP